MSITRKQIELKIVENLRTFGYTNVDVFNIYQEYVLARFSMSIVKDALNQTNNLEVKEILNQILTDLEEVKLNS